MPLRAHNCAILGTLCVIDRKPRAPLGQRELERLEEFASIIMAEAVLRCTADEREQAPHELERAVDFSSVAPWHLEPRTAAPPSNGATYSPLGGDKENREAKTRGR